MHMHMPAKYFYFPSIIITHILHFFAFQVRFVRSDDIWLSPNYKRDSCHITEMIYSLSVETSILYFNSVHNATTRLKALSVYIGESISS